MDKPRIEEDTLKSEVIQIERKTIVCALKANARGRFLRITEEVSGKRNSIVIPASGLEEFKRLIEEMGKANDEIPEAGQRD